MRFSASLTTARLVKMDFVERVYDKSDRRTIKFKTTDKAIDYINYFLKEDAGYYRELLDRMDENKRMKFEQALDIFIEVFSEYPFRGEKKM